jgi:imidazolonepropionase-like amidohydrolase
VPTFAAIQRVWNAQKGLSSDDIDASQKLWAKYREVTAVMKGAGVKFLAGSDLPIGEIAPIHEELVLFVESGFTPMEALEIATQNAAQFAGEREDGTVEAGKLANLLILNASPLDDIRHTRRISNVIVRGAVVR